jgi:hypothetical protein
MVPSDTSGNGFLNVATGAMRLGYLADKKRLLNGQHVALSRECKPATSAKRCIVHH